MALTQVTGPYPIFTDLDGTPLDDGYLYIGLINQDPEQNPIQVFWDSNLTIPATQPIRTSNGYAYRNGTPALLYTAGEFSITIRNKREEFVLYSPVGYGFDPAAVSASVVRNDFTGNGVQVAFVLSASPSTILATNIFINGVYQEKDSYGLSGNTITFSIAPPLSSSIEVMTNETGVINSGNANDISYTLTAAGATLQSVQTKLEQYVSVMDFGAVGDGVADDTAAIDAAEAAAFASNNIMVFPSGKNFTYDGTLTSRVSVLGYGATLTQLATTEALVGFLYFDTVDNIFVHGLAIDGNSTRRPLYFQDCNNVDVQDVNVSNALYGGIACYDGAYIKVSNCTVDGVVLDAVQTSAADGFLFAACQNVQVINCVAKNFERIGYVCETSGTGVKTDNVQFTNCIADTASNCDLTVNEYNAAFWHENTNNVSYVNCSGINIASGVGQTNGRVVGFKAAIGPDKVCQQNYIDCNIIGNTARMPFAYGFQSSDEYANINLVNGFAQKCTVGLNIYGGINEANIKNFQVDDIVCTVGTQGAIQIDLTAFDLNKLTIDGFSVTNKTYAADTADVFFFANYQNLVYSIRNAGPISHLMPGRCKSALADDVIIEYGSTTYPSFNAEQIRFGSNFVGYPKAGGNGLLVTNGGAPGNTVYFAPGSMLTSVTATNHIVPIYDASLGMNIYANGAIFNYTSFEVDMVGTFLHQFSNCVVTNIDATKGFYRANFSTPTKQVLQVTGCRFSSNNVADTPFKKWNVNPTHSVFQSNIYNATALYNFDGGVTQANNTSGI
jgi:hypothetical protein